MQTVSVVETSRNVWRVAFDGRVRGDSRGYDRQGAIAAAEQAVRDEERWAARDGRPIELRLAID